MTEHTPEKVADLIAKSRELIAHTRTYNFGMWSADKLAHEVAGQLVDALEAVAAERDTAIRDLDAGFAESDHLSAKYYRRMRDAEREMHARELHHFEEEQARAKAEAERDEALAVIAEAMPWMDRHSGAGKRAASLLSRIPEHPKED